MFAVESKGWVKLFLVEKEKYMGATGITKSRLFEAFAIKCCFSTEEKYLHSSDFLLKNSLNAFLA